VCARALDALNALDALTEIGRAGGSPRLCGGARVYCSAAPVERASIWVGAVFWRRAAGYLGYKVLTVTGVWACRTASDGVSGVDALARADEAVEIVIGTKRLPFARPFFDPEPYHKLYERDYTLYYDDDGSPPAAGVYCARYDPEARLAQRETVARTLAALCANEEN
jgi:hypothetical protein